jgi:hypothetical protein
MLFYSNIRSHKIIQLIFSLFISIDNREMVSSISNLVGYGILTVFTLINLILIIYCIRLFKNQHRELLSSSNISKNVSVRSPMTSGTVTMNYGDLFEGYQATIAKSDNSVHIQPITIQIQTKSSTSYGPVYQYPRIQKIYQGVILRYSISRIPFQKQFSRPTLV